MDRWTESEAHGWWAARKWVCGFNFLPSSAVNFLEMWHCDTFDAAGIERELAWAAELGYNALRTNPPYIVWKHDRDGLIDRLDRVMAIAARVGISTIPVPFDDCGFGGFEPVYGPQPEPVPGVHNSRATASPGRALLADGTDSAEVRAYLRDLIQTFRTDPRILFWDLYNEPGNRMVFGPGGASVYEPDFTAHSTDLLRDCFSIARDVAPEHPLTVGVWRTAEPGAIEPSYENAIDRIALDHSDIITFHAYLSTSQVAAIIDQLAQFQRPMLCTEWMARHVGSHILDQLALFRDRNVGCVQWGLVRGRTQTWLPWPSSLLAAHGGDATQDVWFHDVLDEEGVPYDAREAQELQRCVASQV